MSTQFTARALLASACTGSFFVSGIIYSFPALELVLRAEKNGTYAELCEEEDNGDCTARDLRLSLIFSAASVSLFAGVTVAGYALDKVGAKPTTVAGLVCALLGSLGFAFSHSQDFDAFVASSVLLSGGGILFHISLMPISNLFGKRKNTATSLIVGMLTLSGYVFPIFRAIVENSAMTRRDIFLAHSGWLFVYLLFVVLVWPPGTLAPGQMVVFSGPRIVRTMEGRQLSMADLAVQSGEPEEEIPTVAESLRRPEFVWITLWWGFNILRINYFIGTVNDQLDSETYSSVFFLLFPLGFVGMPFVGHALDTRGFFVVVTTVSLLGILYGILLMVPVLELQVVTFVTIALHRTALFSTSYAFIGRNFHHRIFGRVTGIANLFAAALGFLQYLLVFLAFDVFDKDFVPTNVMCLVIGLAVCPFSVYLWRRERATPVTKLESPEASGST